VPDVLKAVLQVVKLFIFHDYVTTQRDIGLTFVYKVTQQEKNGHTAGLDVVEKRKIRTLPLSGIKL
jgi:hypothetical protein